MTDNLNANMAPLPWQVDRDEPFLVQSSVLPNPYIALCMRGNAPAASDAASDAAFIVRAANAHDKLVAALIEAERFLEHLAEGWGVFVGPGTPKSCLAQVRAALALAGEKTP